MQCSVIGCGRWCCFIAWYLHHIGHSVTLYGRPGSARLQQLISHRNNNVITLSSDIVLSSDLQQAVNTQLLAISINAQALSELAHQLAAFNIQSKTILLCMKGIEIETGRRLTQIIADTLHSSNTPAVWLGPGHVQELTRGIPNCMVIDCENTLLKTELVQTLSSPLIRFYYGTDLIGNEIGAAAKNVIGVAAGMLDGLNQSALKGALIARGPVEIARLIKALGGDPRSAYGLCHLGDYAATVFSPLSHNRTFGEQFILGHSFDQLAEGIYTVKALHNLAQKHSVSLPICNAVYRVLYEHADSRQLLDELFARPLKAEFLN